MSLELQAQRRRGGTIRTGGRDDKKTEIKFFHLISVLLNNTNFNLKKCPGLQSLNQVQQFFYGDLCKAVQATVIPKPDLLSVNKQIKNELK